MNPENINNAEFLSRVTAVVPEQRQIDFQNLGYYNFIHFGLNTFTKKEWGSGKVNPKVFTLTDIDTDKWAKQLKSTGSTGIILTAKHHDGFCLFPSKYTDTYFGWFWRPIFEIFFTRSVRNLENCYYNSVGANATLLVNVPPNDNGELPEQFIKRLVKARKRIESRFSDKAEIVNITQNKNDFVIKIKPQTVKTVVLSEDIIKSQRIEDFSIIASGKTVYSGTAVGFKKICILKKPVKNCSQLIIRIDRCRLHPCIKDVSVY